MALFNINKKSLYALPDEDKSWVADNFKWLIETFGYASFAERRVLVLNEHYFPGLFAGKEHSIDGCLLDLSRVLGLSHGLAVLEISEELDQPRLDVFPNKKKGRYVITLNQTEFESLPHLIITLGKELAKARMLEEGIELQEDGDFHLFLYVFLVFFGFGIIISHTAIDEKVILENNIVHVSYQGYAQAYYCWTKNENEPVWLNELPQWILSKFNLALKELESQGKNNLLIESFKEQDRSNLQLRNCWHLYHSGHFELANSLCTELTRTNSKDPIILNANGFFKNRLRRYEEAIPFFEKAIKLSPTFNEPYNNLGFAFLMTHDFEAGKQYIEKAIELDDEDPFCYRNLAIYFSIQGDFDKASAFFDRAKALDAKVELLHYYHALALIRQGDMTSAIELLEKSKALGEKEAIYKLSEINRFN